MSNTNPVRTVAAAMADVNRWRTDEEARAKAEKVEVEQEIRNLQTAIQNLQAQLEALNKFGAELDSKKQALAAQELERAHTGVLAALQAQAKAIGLRDQEVGRAVAARDAALSETLRQPDLAGPVEEYRQFKSSVEPTIGALPESYRKVILAHHDTVSARLKGAVTAAYSAPLAVGGDPVECEIVWAIDAPDGKPELLVALLPVSDQVHAHWHDQDEGVQLWLAARVVQALHSTGAGAKVDKLQPMAGGHEGVLVIECDLAGVGDPVPADFGERFTVELAAALSSASEIASVGVKASAVRVEMDVLLPPQEESDAG